MTYLLRTRVPMAVLPNGRSRFGHFLALTVPSAVGFIPKFLHNCHLTGPPVVTVCSHTTSQNSNPIFISAMQAIPTFTE